MTIPYNPVASPLHPTPVYCPFSATRCPGGICTQLLRL